MKPRALLICAAAINSVRRPLPLFGATVLICLAAQLAPATADAHDGRHDFESIITGITPVQRGAGISLRMIDSDERIELVNEGDETVIVMGYDGEPYARVEPSGPVSLNLRSPALAQSNDRWGRTPPNGSEDAAAPPHWVEVGSDGQHLWFDRRSHYRGQGIPPQVTDPTQRQKLWDYRIPLRIGNRPATIHGTLYWTGHRPFPTTAFITMLLATALSALFGAWTLKRLRSASTKPAADQ